MAPTKTVFKIFQGFATMINLVLSKLKPDYLALFMRLFTETVKEPLPASIRRCQAAVLLPLFLRKRPYANKKIGLINVANSSTLCIHECRLTKFKLIYAD